jgi:hypothetical protein
MANIAGRSYQLRANCRLASFAKKKGGPETFLNHHSWFIHVVSLSVGRCALWTLRSEACFGKKLIRFPTEIVRINVKSFTRSTTKSQFCQVLVVSSDWSIVWTIAGRLVYKQGQFLCPGLLTKTMLRCWCGCYAAKKGTGKYLLLNWMLATHLPYHQANLMDVNGVNMVFTQGKRSHN